MNAVPVTVNGVLVRRNDSRLEDFIEAAEKDTQIRLG